jgi:parallel beta-helix repeat protein
MKRILTMIMVFSIAGLLAVTRNVPSEYNSIQAAINACNNGDIVLIAAGTYNENINFQGRLITVTSNYIDNHNPQTILDTVINGTGTGSVVTFSTGEDTTAVLTGLSIKGGNYNLGGGISVRNASPKLANLCLYDNTGAFAAGIYLQSSNAILKNLTVCHNTGLGLRIMASCQSTVSNCILYYNTDGLINLSSLSTISFCDIQETVEGLGNICIDPMFIDGDNHDYTLQEGSPCKNTGSPFCGPDFDGTCPDMGALFLQNSEESVFVNLEAVSFEDMADPTATVEFVGTTVACLCSVSSIYWDFGDGTTSTQISPTHIYQHGGCFTVCLTAVSDLANEFSCVRERYLTIYTKITANDISGTLEYLSSPFYIENTVFVNAEDHLTVEPGVEIYFGTGAGLAVYGQITALGTETGNILFQPYNNQVCGEIYISSAASNNLSYCHFTGFIQIGSASTENGQTTFENCIIENNVIYGLKLIDGNGTVRNSIIRNNGTNENFGAGLYIASPHVMAENNQFSGNRICTIQIWCLNGLETILQDNTIINGNLNTAVIAVMGNSSATIMGNDISNGSMGIGFDTDSYAHILNNVIHDNYWGIDLYFTNLSNPTYIQGNLVKNNYGSGILLRSSSAFISNNTIVNNNTLHSVDEAGIWFTGSNDSQIVNNIIWGNTNDFGRSETTSTPEASYNLTEFPLTEIVADMGNNLYGDPDFLSETDFRLSANSPCIDSGDMSPVYYELIPIDLQGLPRVFDGDNNGLDVIDRGCYEYNPAQGNDDDILPIPDRLKVVVYPNPFNPMINISFVLNENGNARVNIYNLKGQLVQTLAEGKFNAGMHNLSWDGTDIKNKRVSSGIYFCSVRYDKQTILKKMVLQK